MASKNLNKIVRANINLQPWLSSKSPTGIVNSYVQRLYEQLPDNLKSGLIKSRVTPFEMQTRVLPRPVKVPAERLMFPIVNKQKPKLHTANYRSPPLSTKNSYVKAPKKLLKTPNFKIYNTRRFVSSASSSTASILRNNHYEGKSKMYTPANAIQLRTFTGAATQGASFYNNPGVAKYIAPTRIYNEHGVQERSLEITNAICRDLMSVNEMLKQNIRVAKPKVNPAMVPVELGMEAAMRGWNHPVASNLKGFTEPPRINSSKPLERVQTPRNFMPPRGRHQEKAGNEASSYNRRENNRHQMPTVPRYTSVVSTSKGAKNVTKEKKEIKPVKPTYDWDPLDFVCRSRGNRVLRNSTRNLERESLKSLQKC